MPVCGNGEVFVDGGVGERDGESEGGGLAGGVMGSCGGFRAKDAKVRQDRKGVLPVVLEWPQMNTDEHR